MTTGNLDSAVESILTNKVGLKAGDSVSILTDRGVGDLGFVFFKKAYELGLRSSICDMQPLSADGEEPPEHIAGTMKKAETLIIITSTSLDGTKALADAKSSGVKVFDFAGTTEEKLAEFS
jgi:hypothetical protein